jgi:protein-disulfide isomerase
MNTTESGATLAMPVLPQRDHIRGTASAAVTLVEYGDYECPYCRAAHGVVDAIQARLQSQLAFVFRHFPLTTVHPHAQAAAEAAEAAASQRKFWQMHDTLFTTEVPFTQSLFIAAAAALGLDMGSFHSELIRHVHVPRIREDFMTGVRSGVNGTPTFYINAVRYDGGWDLHSLGSALNRALLPPGGADR